MALRIGELLMQRGLLTQEQLAQALHGQAIFGGRLGTNLVEMGFVTEEQIAACLSQQLGLPCARPQWVAAIEREVIACMSRDMAERYRVIPLRKEGRDLHVGLADPQNLERVDELSFAMGCPLRPYVITEVTLNYALERYYGIRREVRYLKLAGAEPAEMRLTTIAESVEHRLITPPATPAPILPDLPPPAPPLPGAPGADLVERLANVMSDADFLEIVFQFLIRLFGEVAILVPRGEIVQGVMIGNRNARRPYATALHAPCTPGTLIGDVINKAQMAFRNQLNDDALLALCHAASIRPEKIAVIPIFDNRTPVLVAIGQGMEHADLVGRVEGIRNFLAKASSAFQIIALRKQILTMS
jgi:Type II secretion system (T2SS), protein E, N-terminal domain